MAPDPTPTVPGSIDDVTPAWLTGALRDAGTIDTGTSVTTVRAEAIAEGVGFLSRIYRLHLSLDGDGPATLVAKLPTDTAYLQLAEMTGAYHREVAFYARVAPDAPLRTPRAHVAAIDDRTGAFVLVLDDLAHLDGADHVAGLSFARAEAVVDELARFHAWGWGLAPEAARDDAFPALDDPVTAGLYTQGIAAGWRTHEQHGRAAPPAGLAAFVADYATTAPALLASLAEPATLLNGDLRADNLFFDADGRPSTVDFQLVMRGSGIWDVAYLTGQGLAPRERDGRERDLVTRYVRGLEAAGVEGYTDEQAWRQFRVATALQVTFPLTAMMSWETLNPRAHDLLLALAERSFAIIADTDALDAIDAG